MIAVITDIRYRMTLALARDLHEHSIRVVGCYSGIPPFTAKSKAIERSIQVPNNYDHPDEYVHALHQVCHQVFIDTGEKPILLPVSTRDMELLSAANARAMLASVCKIAISDEATLDYANNKLRVMELCESLDIPVPKTEHPTSAADFYSYRYPLIVKPVCGEKQGLKAGERYIVTQTAEEAIKAWEHFVGLCGETVVQSYITGEVIAHTVVIQDGKIITGVVEGTRRTRFLDGGHPTLTYTCSDECCIETSNVLAKTLNLTGLFMFQYIRSSSGTLYMMEINCRMCGSYPVCRASRSSISYDWFAVSAGISPLSNHGRLGVYHYFFPSEVLFAVEMLEKGKPLKAIHDLLVLLPPRNKEGLFELSDLRASLAYIGYYIREACKGSRGSSVRSSS